MYVNFLHCFLYSNPHHSICSLVFRCMELPSYNQLFYLRLHAYPCWSWLSQRLQGWQMWQSRILLVSEFFCLVESHSRLVDQIVRSIIKTLAKWDCVEDPRQRSFYIRFRYHPRRPSYWLIGHRRCHYHYESSYFDWLVRYSFIIKSNFVLNSIIKSSIKFTFRSY